MDALFTEDKVLVAGDFNARHVTWRNRNNNRNGNTIFDYTLENNVAVCAPSTPTHYPRNGMRPTIIDIVLNKNYKHTLAPHSVTALSSDHNPVHFQIPKTSMNETESKNFNYKSTNWTRFRQILNEQTTINNDIKNTADIDEEIQKLTDNVLHARRKTTPIVTLKPKQEDIPQNIQNLITFKNRLKRQWHRNRRRVDRIRLTDVEKTVNKRLSDWREAAWSQKINSLKTSDNSLWKLSRLLRKPFASMPTLQKNDTYYTLDKDKADVIARELQNICTTEADTTDKQKTISHSIQDIQKRYHIPINTLKRLQTSPSEIKDIIKNLPYNKAPGPDSIPNILLKNLPRKVIVQINYIINSIIKYQYYPKSFKLATVIPIQKPGKQPDNPQNYRPIALLNSLSKITEKIIHKRLLNFINDNDTIPDCQLGFRGGASTVHATARLVQDALYSFNKKQVTVALLLDIERAFDRVWHGGLLYKLKNTYNFPDYFTALIKSYLENRYIQVKVNNKLSDKYKLGAGVPQGTVLSPLLFSLYLSDIPSHPTTKLLLFADDTVTYANSFSAETANVKVKYHLRKLLKYYADWKIKINETKTETLLLTKKFTNTQISWKTKINDKTIEEKRAAKYLGVTLDKTLSFKPHTTKTIQKTYMTLTKLYPLVNRRSTLPIKTKLLLYKTIIRPTITYAAPVWHNMSNTQYNRLQTTQNKILRLLTNSNRYVNMTQLHQEHKIEKIKPLVKEYARKFYNSKLDNCNITRNLKANILDRPYRHKLLHNNVDDDD